MEKSKVIVDTCFLQKLSSEGKHPENIKKVLDELGVVPVCHPYIAKHEFGLYSYLDNLVKSGYIKEIPYDDFISEDVDKQLYEAYFMQLHEELRLHLEAKNVSKKLPKLNERKNLNIYETHMQGSSMGDVHMILMAVYTGLPVILTEDQDIEVLRTLAKRRMNFGSYSLDIYNGIDLVRQIATKSDAILSKKELEQILKAMGERKYCSEIKTIWNENHKL